MFKKKINFKFNLLWGIIVISFLIRLITTYFFRDPSFDSANTEWGVLVYNLVNFKSYSIYHFDNILVPSVYMPPGYPLLLYIIKMFSLNDAVFLNLIMLFQIILGTYSIYVFYKINLYLFSHKLSLINSFIFSIFPLNIYMVGQLSSITLTVFLSLIFLDLLFMTIKKNTLKNIIFLSIISGLLIITRGEFILIFASIIFFVILKKKINPPNILKIILITSLVISPYMIRNYLHFNQIMLTKSLGFNLWKGNNELSSVQGYEEYKNLNFKELEFKLNSLEKNKRYELNRDELFLSEAKKYLAQDPLRYLNLFFKKIFSFYFVDLNSTYPNYYNFIHFFPVVLFSILSFPGLFILYKKKNIYADCLGLYLLFNIVIFSCFFILPRFKLIILPVQIILVAYFIKYLLNKLNMKNL